MYHNLLNHREQLPEEKMLHLQRLIADKWTYYTQARMKVKDTVHKYFQYSTSLCDF